MSYVYKHFRYKHTKKSLFRLQIMCRLLWQVLKNKFIIKVFCRLMCIYVRGNDYHFHQTNCALLRGKGAHIVTNESVCSLLFILDGNFVDIWLLVSFVFVFWDSFWDKRLFIVVCLKREHFRLVVHSRVNISSYYPLISPKTLVK